MYHTSNYYGLFRVSVLNWPGPVSVFFLVVSSFASWTFLILTRGHFQYGTVKDLCAIFCFNQCFKMDRLFSFFCSHQWQSQQSCQSMTKNFRRNVLKSVHCNGIILFLCSVTLKCLFYCISKSMVFRRYFCSIFSYVINFGFVTLARAFLLKVPIKII